MPKPNNQIHQHISAHLKLPQYKQDALIPLRDSFSVYKLNGSSEVLRGYEYNVDFVSDETIAVEDIVDTQAQLSLRDEIKPLNSKKIYGTIDVSTLYHTYP